MKIGILGAGQLGRMLALAGYPHSHQFKFYETSGSPSAGIGSIISDTTENNDLLQQFLDDVDVVTYEFENIPLALTQAVEQQKTLHPSSESIRVCQNRKEEKALFSSLGIQTARYKIVNSADELECAAEELGCPVVAKSITDGYDGKGQGILKKPSDANEVWTSINHTTLIVESFVNFSRELSIIAVRGKDGNVVFYPLAENVHRDGILRFSVVPAPAINQEIQSQAETYIKTLLEELNHVGVLTLELFETAEGLLANEMAPRVHNSGHWSMNGSRCDQFENHIRAVCEMPLGDTSVVEPTCMINLIGHSAPPQQLLKLPYVHLHMYGKEEREGRKIGHINICAPTYKELLLRVENTLEFLPSYPKIECSLNAQKQD